MTAEKGFAAEAPRVGLLVTCLVDLFRPSVGFAAIKLLEAGGAEVEVPGTQTCCGQPAYNSGDRDTAAAIARQVVDAFERFDYVVVPSGSCAGMLKLHYPELLADDPIYAERAERLAERSFELTRFLIDVLGPSDIAAPFPGRVTYHPSCSSLREAGVGDAAERLLGRIDGLELVKLEDAEMCCGFGGTFAVKYPAIATAIVDAKIRNIQATKARCVTACDLGCLVHIAGRLSREGIPVEVRHVAEILAGVTHVGPIGGTD